MTSSYAQARQNMVDNQLRANKVIDEPLLALMGGAARETFVPPALRAVAYVDEDLPLGGGRFLIEPMVLARLIQALAPQPGDKALDLGCATGYSSALLAGLAGSVVAVESDARLAGETRGNLAALGLANATVVSGPLDAGHPALGPYDVILVDGAIERLPRAILDQLAYGGRIAAVFKRNGRMGEASLWRGNPPARTALFDAATPLLAEFAAEPSFVF